MYNLTDRTVVLGVTGSIAIYKAVDLASKLTQAGARVEVVMTPEAARFVSPITFDGVTGRRAVVDMWEPPVGPAEAHVALARAADVLVVAPATATTLARLALGLAEEMVSLTALATRAPLLLCPAMDHQMYAHPATQAHVRTLAERGAYFVGPEEGRLASGQIGLGRMSEVETIVAAVRYALGRNGDLAGKKILVTAGGTQEPIDPVRYVGNYSSGKMGFAVAEAARDRGADVVLVAGPSGLPDPYGVRTLRVRRAVEMRDAVAQEAVDSDAVIMAAAVADYEPERAAKGKIKREERDGLTLHLVRTPDILAELSTRRRLVKVGFAAESHDLLANARLKLKRKNLDLIVANDITEEGSGFGSDTNKVTILDGEGEEDLPLMSKYEVAWHILDKVSKLLRKKAAP